MTDAVLVVEGELDLNTIGQLRGQLAEAVERGGGDVVVDLSAVTYLDSTALATLLNALRRLTRGGRRLALVAPTGSAARRILSLTRLDTTFRILEHP